MYKLNKRIVSIYLFVDIICSNWFPLRDIFFELKQSVNVERNFMNVFYKIIFNV